VAASVSLLAGLAVSIVSRGDRSVFEKGLGIEELDFELEATTPEDGAVASGGRDAEGAFAGDDAAAFTEAAARFMAARPPAVVTDDWELALLGVLATEGDEDAREEQLCELGKRCSGQNF